MIRDRLHDCMPRSLFARAALILLLPVAILQLVVSVAFVQRYYADVSRQMVRSLLPSLEAVEAAARGGDDAAVAATLGLALSRPGPAPAADRREAWDVAGRAMIAELRSDWPAFRAADLSVPGRVALWADLGGPARIEMERTRLAASNPHQLLVWTLVSGLLLSAIAALFLRNQVRPIRRLARAAAAYGRGRIVPFRPSGAAEVRAAGTAFLEMRRRIERQAQARTQMLAGVSHDLRTPLTRMRLQLSLMEGGDAEALGRDVEDMTRMVDAFLAFARGDAGEESAPTDLAALVRAVAEEERPGGRAVFVGVEGAPARLAVRPSAVRRAVENLVANALAHAARVEVSVAFGERAARITVEDDGPGIPPSRREEAMRPFVRLDEARGRGDGAPGVGLGLAIVADVARGHGGQLRLGASARLGGLRADLLLAR